MTCDFRAIKTIAHLARAIATPIEILEAFLNSPSRHLKKLTVPRRKNSKRPRVVWNITAHQVKASLQNLNREFDGFLRRYLPDQYPLLVVHGYVQGRSALSNATQHAGCQRLIKVDVRDFFPSISAEALERCLIGFDLSPRGAKLIARLVTLRGKLAVGYPTSPLFSNIAMIERDFELNDLAQEYSATYTRYADDITFSTKLWDLPSKPEIKAILKRSKLKVSPKKCIERKHGQALYVTGYSVTDEKPRAPKTLKRQLRQALYYINKFGLRSHAKRVRKESEGRLFSKIPGMIAHVRSAEKDLAEEYEVLWLTRKDANRAVQDEPRRARTSEPVALIFDDSRFTAHGVTYHAIGTARVREAGACAELLAEKTGDLRLSPMMPENARAAIAENGIHYAELPEDFRRDVIELMVLLPAVGHIVFARARPGLTKKDHLKELLASALKARLIDCRDKLLSIVFEEGDYINPKEAAKAVRAAITAMPKARRPKLESVKVVAKSEDANVALPDVFMGVWQQFARGKDPARFRKNDRDKLLFDTIRPKLGTIYDMDSGELFTNRKPFKPFPGPFDPPDAD